MKDVMGLIFTGENDIHLGELTSLRAVAALPIAGRYRVIDFQLSSMVHSGIKNVGVITQKNYSSLMDHIGSGREWDLHGKQGLVMLPPFLTRENMGVYSGLLDALKSNCTYLRLSRQEYIVLTNSHTIYNMDYTDALKYHVEKGADVTVLYAHGAKAVGTEGENDTFLSVDEDGKVTGMEIGSSVPTRDCASLKVYITKRELLRQLVEQAAANGMHDFDRDILQRNINDGNLRVYGYEYKGLACQIDSIQSYFNFNMSLLSGDVRRQLFPADRPVYTKVRDDLPARYVDECECSNSLIANGCVLISQHADSMGAPTACEKAGVPNVSYNGSTVSVGPNTYIISSRIDWAPYYVYAIQAAMDGKTIDADWTGTLATKSVVLSDLNTNVAADGTQAAIDEAMKKLENGELHVFDVSTFTVTGENVTADMKTDAEGHLTSYMADVDNDANMEHDTEVVHDGYFAESEKRSAPYFDIAIDGIVRLDVNFG